MFTRLTVLGCALVVLLALPSSAIATHVSCGDVITQDTTLDSDLVNCPGDGVVIGASNITLDLAGLTLLEDRLDAALRRALLSPGYAGTGRPAAASNGARPVAVMQVPVP